jgi:hypothetical protein
VTLASSDVLHSRLGLEIVVVDICWEALPCLEIMDVGWFNEQFGMGPTSVWDVCYRQDRSTE